MKAHTSEFKENIKLLGREFDSKLLYELDDEVIELGSDDLNSVTIHYEGAILKSVMKQLDIDCKYEIPVGTIVRYRYGIFIEDNEEGHYEYVDYGNYIVKEVEKKEDTNSYLIKCYDKMLNAMRMYETPIKYRLTIDETFEEGKTYYIYENDEYVEYVEYEVGDEVPENTIYEYTEIYYPITIDEYIKELCDWLGLTFKNYQGNYANHDKSIANELYKVENSQGSEYTFRDVFDELAQVTASTICINEQDDELEIRYITDTNDTIDEEYLKNVNVNFGKKFGPVNSVVLSRSAGSDNIYEKDDESIEENGLCEIKIEDNQIMNFDNRDEFLADIFEVLNGLEYYINDFSSTGIAYYELCDKYNISITKYDEETEEETTTIYPCIMFNDEIAITQGLEETINTEEPQETETDYEKADKTDRKINKTTLIVDKQNHEIIARVETIEQDLEENYITSSQVNEMIIDSENGVKNTLIKAGGNNLIRNSALLFKDTEGNFEYWEGDLERVRAGDYLDDSRKAIISETGTAILTSLTGSSQSITAVPDKYTLSFKYQRVLELGDLTFKVNGDEVPITNMEAGRIEYTFDLDEDNSNITILFNSSIDEGYIIYDLMLNKGDTALDYSQNANETTTDSVRIGKGIAVTSDEDTLTRIDGDGFRVLNKNDESDVLLRATDTGTDTKTLQVRSWAEISGLRFQETSEQTWITGII